MHLRGALVFAVAAGTAFLLHAGPVPPPPTPAIPPVEIAGKLSPHRSPLLFNDGREVKTAVDWKERRQEIRETWNKIMGEWPSLVEHPKIENLESVRR